MDFKLTRRTAFLLVWDIVATFAAYTLASSLTGLFDEVFATHEIYFVLGATIVLSLIVFIAFKLYDTLWEYASTDDMIRIVISVGIATLMSAVVLWIIDEQLPIRIYFVAFFLIVFLSGGMRMLFRILPSKRRELKYSAANEIRPRTLIIGAGETGSLAIRRMVSKDPLMVGYPVAAIDDDTNKIGQHIHGVRVVGTSDEIIKIVERLNIEQIVVAIPSATLEERRRIYGICTKTNCQLRTLPNVRELKVEEIGDIQLREVDVADLLGREEIVLNTGLVCGYISGRTILVTGGGGSIGSELCRQMCAAYPARIVIFDMYENDAYLLRREITEKHPDIECIVEIGSICNIPRLRAVFEKYQPSVVFHAAAHKHVPLMELTPREAIYNNVFGTLNTVRLSDEFGVDRFIFISTDKAVNPTSVMGATKRMGEMVIQHYARESKTVYAAVRFGNVLGSNGSVIPLFKKQIAAGGPVTVTDPEIERFFMTIPEASRLVIQAGGMAKGGEIFILDMGEPVKIVNLAKSLIKLSGLRVDEDIKIVYTGMRPGEKMYEELLMNEENTLPTDIRSIMVSTGKEISFSEVNEKLEELKVALEKSESEAREVLERVVPTYTPPENVEHLFD